MNKFIVPLWMNPIPHGQGIKIRTNRWGRASTYKTEKLAAFQQQFAMLLNSQVKKAKFQRIEGDYGIAMIFYLKNKKHGDLTNLQKTCEDAMEGIIFFNDKYAKEIIVKREYDNLNPRIEIEIWPIDNTNIN